MTQLKKICIQQSDEDDINEILQHMIADCKASQGGPTPSDNLEASPPAFMPLSLVARPSLAHVRETPQESCAVEVERVTVECFHCKTLDGRHPVASLIVPLF